MFNEERSGSDYSELMINTRTFFRYKKGYKIKYINGEMAECSMKKGAVVTILN